MHRTTQKRPREGDAGDAWESESLVRSASFDDLESLPEDLAELFDSRENAEAVDPMVLAEESIRKLREECETLREEIRQLKQEKKTLSRLCSPVVDSKSLSEIFKRTTGWKKENIRLNLIISQSFAGWLSLLAEECDPNKRMGMATLAMTQLEKLRKGEMPILFTR